MPIAATTAAIVIGSISGLPFQFSLGLYGYGVSVTITSLACVVSILVRIGNKNFKFAYKCST